MKHFRLLVIRPEGGSCYLKKKIPMTELERMQQKLPDPGAARGHQYGDRLISQCTPFSFDIYALGCQISVKTRNNNYRRNSHRWIAMGFFCRKIYILLPKTLVFARVRDDSTQTFISESLCIRLQRRTSLKLHISWQMRPSFRSVL